MLHFLYGLVHFHKATFQGVPMFMNFYLSRTQLIQSITSSEICARHLTQPSAHTPGAVGSRHCGTPEEQLGDRCLAQGSHLSF